MPAYPIAKSISRSVSRQDALLVTSTLFEEKAKEVYRFAGASRSCELEFQHQILDGERSSHAG